MTREIGISNGSWFWFGWINNFIFAYGLFVKNAKPINVTLPVKLFKPPTLTKALFQKGFLAKGDEIEAWNIRGFWFISPESKVSKLTQAMNRLRGKKIILESFDAKAMIFITESVALYNINFSFLMLEVF